MSEVPAGSSSAKRWGFGIIGCGNIATTHARALAAIQNARLVAVADSVPERARGLAAELGVDAETPERLLERADVGVVSVCVPSGLHAEVAVAAARAGKHLVVEKPLETTLQAADAILEAVDNAGVRLTVISQHRFDPGVVELRRLVYEGALGRLVHGSAYCKWYRSDGYYQSGSWRGTRDLDGGALSNQGVHYLDLLLWFMGEVKAVSGVVRTALHKIEAEDVALAHLIFESGATGSVEATTCFFPGLPERLELVGEAGSAVIEAGQLVLVDLKAERDDVGDFGGRPRYRKVDAASEPAWAGHARQLADFIDCLDQGRSPLVGGEDGRRAVAVIDAVYRSAREQNWVKPS